MTMVMMIVMMKMFDGEFNNALLAHGDDDDDDCDNYDDGDANDDCDDDDDDGDGVRNE